MLKSLILHPEKTFAPKLSTFLGILIVVIPEFLNAPTDIDVKLSGNSMLLSDAHPSNAEALISVTPSGMTML